MDLFTANFAKDHVASYIQAYNFLKSQISSEPVLGFSIILVFHMKHSINKYSNKLTE